MPTNPGNTDLTLDIVAGLALIATAATGTIGVWGSIGMLPSPAP
jgi:hypothetical protein